MITKRATIVCAGKERLRIPKKEGKNRLFFTIVRVR